MKRAKAGIKTRVFLGFGLFVIIIINLFLFALYNLLGTSFFKNTEKNINISLQELIEEINKNHQENKKYIFNISKTLTKKIEEKELFFYIFLKNENINEQYKIGTYIYKDKIIARKDFKDYNILIGRDIKQLNNFKESIIDQILFINLFSILLVFAMSYFMADRILTPLLHLSKRLTEYNIETDKNLIENKFGESEIGVITDAVNNFIENSKNILENQKQFIQNSSHELKTPLMQIESNIELIEDKITDEKVRKKLASIKSSTENMNTIVSNLSFIMREDKKITKKETIDMKKYLENFITNFYALANEKSIMIDVVTKENFLLENSPYYLDRLFGNLLQNSIFYNNGSNTITVIIDKNTVTIEDQGIGISSKELEKIFARFYRNSTSSDYNKNGSGLGLTIVQKICTDFGWKLSVASKKGTGSMFKIEF